VVVHAPELVDVDARMQGGVHATPYAVGG
jgi:hypothetical protein